MTGEPQPSQIEVSILIESYNHAEGSPLERLFETLRPAVALARRHGAAEVLLADSSADPELLRRLEAELPEVRRIEASGSSYDEAKMAAAAQARGRWVVFLDGDCIPLSDDWLEAHLRTLRAGARASCGMTRYEGGFLQRMLSVLDFGFLLPATPRPVPCYASNNVAFERSLLEACPVPDAGMRCNCYLHAQTLAARDAPVMLSPAATVEHEVKPFWPERLRRGYDHVAAVWANPSLPERRLLALGPLAAPLLLAREVALDLGRLRAGWRAVGFSPVGAVGAVFLLPLVRAVDLIGITRALITPRSRRPQGTSGVPALESQA